MANFMKTLAVIVLVLAIVGSFVVGKALEVILSGLLLSAVSFGILYSVGCALEDLHRIAVASEKANDLLKGFQGVDAPESPQIIAQAKSGYAPTQKSTAAKPSLRLKICPKCSAENGSDKMLCYKCGAFLR